MAKQKSTIASIAPPPKSSHKSSTTTSSTRMLTIIALGVLISFLAGCALHPPEIIRSCLYGSSTLTTLLQPGHYTLACQDAYPKVGRCSPPQTCGRLVVDDFATPEEVELLRSMADIGQAFGRGHGGPTIFDTVTGAASKESAFIDAYEQMRRKLDATLKKKEDSKELIQQQSPSFMFNATHLQLYRATAKRVKDAISREFGVSDLYLTSPSFFSRITSAEAKTEHDEYWHEHIDKLQYGSFMYTALIYLSDHGTDFTGGEFLFVDKDSKDNVISKSEAHPKKGRMMAFTSGKENVHYVSKVTSGARYALTIAFTCDKKKSVEATLFKRAEEMLELYQASLPKPTTPTPTPPAVDTTS